MEAAPDPATSPPPEIAAVKKPAWNIPSNGPIEVGPPVIDESSWPALSESAKSPLKVSDGSTATSVGASSSSSPSKPQFAIQNPNSPTNPKKSTTKRNIITSSNGPTTPMMPPQTTPNPDTENKVVTDSWDVHTQVRQGNKENATRGGGRGYNGNRRGGGNGGRGGVHHGGGGRGRGGGGFEGQFRNLGGREMNGPPPPHGFGVPPPYARPPPPPPLPGAVPAPFIASPTVRPPFGAPMVYPDMPPSPVYYVPAQASPFVPHPVGPTPVFFPPPLDPQRAALLKQIDYYFSPDNLCKDIWLRGHMDEQGWVPISLIAGFNKVKHITTNIPLILDTVRLSTVVEVQGDKIRKHGDWMAWMLPPENLSATTAPVTPSHSTHSTDTLTSQFQAVSLTGSSNQSDANLSGSGTTNLKSTVEEETTHIERN